MTDLETLMQRYPDPIPLVTACRDSLEYGRKLVVCHPGKDGDHQVVEIFSDIPLPPDSDIEERLRSLEKEENRYVREWKARGLMFRGRTVLSRRENHEFLRENGNIDFFRAITATDHQSAWEIRDLLRNWNFTLAWEGWDEDEQFVRQGIIRTAHPGIVLDLDGTYICSPRCSDCGEKTGACRCSPDFYEIVGYLEEGTLCWACWMRREFEKARASGKSIFREEMERFVEELPEHHPEIAGRSEGKPWHRVIEENWDEYMEYMNEESTNWDDDPEGYCECPLGV